ncbi:MAG: glycosyltransferase family 4 protein [Parasphingorhabdus sp.]
MSNQPSIIHLLDDFTLGGVTKSIELFNHPAFARRYRISIEEAYPVWSIAPQFSNPAIIVVHFSISWKTLPYLYSLASRNSGAQLILVEHSYSREWEQLHVPDQTRFRSMLKLVHKIFDRVICVSNEQAKWLAEATNLKSPKRHVIYPWSNMSGLLSIDRPHFSQKDSITIGAYGRFVDDKGFDRLIEAMNKLGAKENIKLNIGGFGPEEASLKRLAAYNPNISFYGKVSDIGHYLNQCDIVAIPSRFEAYGLVATEARYAARPILVSNVGGLPEQIGEAGISVDFDDIDAVVRTLRNIRHLPLVSMSVAGRDDCLRITEQRITDWIELIDTLLGNDGLEAAA